MTLVMVMALLPVAHAEVASEARLTGASTRLGLSGEENDTLAVILEVTQPGAAPEKWGGGGRRCNH